MLASLGFGACHHSGPPGTPHGNELILGQLGIPEMAGQPAPCPSLGGEALHGKCLVTF